MTYHLINGERVYVDPGAVLGAEIAYLIEPIAPSKAPIELLLSDDDLPDLEG